MLHLMEKIIEKYRRKKLIYLKINYLSKMIEKNDINKSFRTKNNLKFPFFFLC